MSGQIVGEVLAAADSLRAAGVKMRAYLALIAIAEKADTGDRTASVRWGHIQSVLYDRASLRTAERAVSELRCAGLVDVVRRGFDNHHGRVAAPVYRVAPRLAAIAEGLAAGSCAGRTRQPGGGVEGGGEPANQVAESRRRTRQIEGANPPNLGGEPATQGGGLDVSLDGSPDVTTGRARKAAPPQARTERGNRLPDGWLPDRPVVDAMRAECPAVDLAAEHRKFTDYWLGQPGAKGRKTDWNATWRNWIRRSAEYRGGRNGPRDGPSAFDRKSAHNADVMARLIERGRSDERTAALFDDAFGVSTPAGSGTVIDAQSLDVTDNRALERGNNA